MSKSVLDGKRMLAVDDEPDILAVLEQEIMEACPSCTFDKAVSYEEAVKLLDSKEYDLVILDIMGVRGFDVLEMAVKKNLRAVMLTAHGLSAEAMKRSHDMGARAYLPKDKLGEIVPFLEDALTHAFDPGWKRVLDKLHDYYTALFKTDYIKEMGCDWRKTGRPY